MTRELKLALIVGFALVLLVTVLISDHLSKARKAQLAGNVTDAPTGVVTAPNEPAPGPVVTINQGTGGGIITSDKPVLIGPAPTDPNAGLVVKDPANDPTITSQIATRGGETLPVMPPMVRHLRSQYDQRSLPTASIQGSPPMLVPVGGRRPSIPPTMAETKPSVPPRYFDGIAQQPINAESDVTPSRSAPELAEKVAHDREAAAPKGDERWHTVANGESTLCTAARHEVLRQAGEYWTTLKEANSDLAMGAKGQLRVGVKVRIPDPASMGIKEAPKADKPEVTKPKETRIASDKPKAEKAEVSKPKGPRSYTVQKGDTLGTISQKQLGSSKRVDDILKLNKDIRNPNALRVGAKIVLPAA